MKVDDSDTTAEEIAEAMKEAEQARKRWYDSISFDDRKSNWYMWIMVFCVLLVSVASLYNIMKKEDTDRATFMLKCMQEYNLSVEECEKILRGEVDD